MNPTYKKGKKRSNKLSIAIAVIIILVALIIFATIYTQPHVYYINAPTSLGLALNSSILYKLPSSTDTFALYLKNSTNNSATLYITKTPVLAYPVLAIYLTKGGSANISSEESKVADMHILLLSSNYKGAELELTPIDPSLGLKPSGLSTVLQPTSFIERMLYTGNVSIISTTSTTTSTSITTTTINQSSIIPMQQIMDFVNTTAPGMLMNSFAALYQKDSVCNASVYNATFQTLENMKAVGPNSFYNVSPSVPRSININVTKIASNTYLVTYIGVTPSKLYTSALLNLKVSLTPTPILLNVSFEGPFKNMNLTQVTKIYTFQSSIQNFCGAYMPYIP
ncbi:MAG: hypothetical protein RXP92_00550 [Candidatus Micrarchaeota archaeon]